MDIAKYIGLYLLKNKFCYLHGLGNLQMKKKPATYDGEVISAAQYEVTLSPTGSIDDSLANFIATAEQTSISKSSNEIREFVAGLKVDLSEGKDVAIPGLGHFTASGGTVRFISDANLAYVPPPIPTLRMSERLEEAPSFKRNTPEEDSKAERSGINRTKVLITVFSAVVIVAIIIAALVFYNNRSTTAEEAPVQNQEEAMPAPVYADSNAMVPPAGDSGVAPAMSPAAVSTNPSGWKIVLNTYTNSAAAERRVRFLKSTAVGDLAQVVTLDSTQHLVTIPFTAPAGDSTRVLDSLARVYGGKTRLLK